MMHRLGHQVLVEALHAEFSARSALPDTTEGNLILENDVLVDL